MPPMLRIIDQLLLPDGGAGLEGAPLLKSMANILIPGVTVIPEDGESEAEAVLRMVRKVIFGKVKEMDLDSKRAAAGLDPKTLSDVSEWWSRKNPAGPKAKAAKRAKAGERKNGQKGRRVQ
jgi:hypothetical protein